MVLYLPGMYELARDCDFGTRCDFTDREIWNIFSAVQANTRDEHQAAKDNADTKAKAAAAASSFTSAASGDPNQFAFGGKLQQTVGGEIVFTEFQEVLGALSVLNNPNPYVPLHSKYEEFLHMEVYPFAKTSAQRPGSTASSRASSRPGSSALRQKAPPAAPGQEEKGQEEPGDGGGGGIGGGGGGGLGNGGEEDGQVEVANSGGQDLENLLRKPEPFAMQAVQEEA